MSGSAHSGSPNMGSAHSGSPHMGSPHSGSARPNSGRAQGGCNGAAMAQWRQEMAEWKHQQGSEYTVYYGVGIIPTLRGSSQLS